MGLQVGGLRRACADAGASRKHRLHFCVRRGSSRQTGEQADTGVCSANEKNTEIEILRVDPPIGAADVFIMDSELLMVTQKND